MKEYKNYFNTYKVVYENDDGEKQEIIVPSKSKEQAYTTIQMLHPKIISISVVGDEKDFSKKETSLSKEDDILDKEKELASGVYHQMKLYSAGGLTDAGKYVEKKISARSEEAARMIAEMRYPELKNVQVVEAEDFESVS